MLKIGTNFVYDLVAKGKKNLTLRRKRHSHKPILRSDWDVTFDEQNFNREKELGYTNVVSQQMEPQIIDESVSHIPSIPQMRHNPAKVIHTRIPPPGIEVREEFYENGDIKSYREVKLTDDKQECNHGVCRNWHPTNFMSEDWKEQNGKKEGQHTTYRDDGSVWTVVPYTNNVKHGLEIILNNEQQSVSEHFYHTGEKHGGYWLFYDNHSLKEEGIYHRGKLEGQVTEWYLSGKVKSIVTYTNGKKEGKKITYYDIVSNCVTIGNYELRGKGGLIFDEIRGPIKKVYFYRQDCRSGKQCWYNEIGGLIKESHYYNNCSYGRTREYYDDCELKSTRWYKDGICVDEFDDEIIRILTRM